MELFERRDGGALNRLVEAEPRAVSLVLGRLWDTVPERRAMAARTLGCAARAHPDLARELARRLLWALNDESASNGVHGIAALGEMGAARPDVIGPFVGPLASHLVDPGLRCEILRALSRVAESAPDMVSAHRAEVERNVVPTGGEERELLTRLFRILEGSRHGT